MNLPKVTQAERTAAELREMARRLILQAEALESTVPAQSTKKPRNWLGTKKEYKKLTQC